MCHRLGVAGRARRRSAAYGRVLSRTLQSVRRRPRRRGDGVTSPRLPFLSLTPREDAADVRAAIDRVVNSGWFVLGPEVEAFEHEFAAASGAACAVGVGSGTDAIALVLRALDIGAGDEVITSPLSAAYSALAIVTTGARPVFADIDPARLTLDPDRVEALIGPRT